MFSYNYDSVDNTNLFQSISFFSRFMIPIYKVIHDLHCFHLGLDRDVGHTTGTPAASLN